MQWENIPTDGLGLLQKHLQRPPLVRVHPPAASEHNFKTTELLNNSYNIHFLWAPKHSEKLQFFFSAPHQPDVK